METNSENSVILEKTRELCQAIVEQLDFQTIRQRVDAFLADESIKLQYQELSDRGAMLQHKQQTGMPRSEEHTSELQSRLHLVCRLLLEKKKKKDVRCT